MPDLPDSLSHLKCRSCFKRYRTYRLPKLPDKLISLDCKTTLLNEIPRLPSTLQILKCGYNVLTTLPTLPSGLLLLKYKNNLRHELLLPLLPIRSNNANECINKLSPDTIKELNVRHKSKRWSRIRYLLSKNLVDVSASNIQKSWKRYWMTPYKDPLYPYPVPKYMLSKFIPTDINMDNLSLL